MSLILLFEDTTAKIDALELDAMLVSEHVVENEITQHPVEVGADVTDHVRPKPDRLTIEGIVSATPVQFGGNARVGLGYDDNRVADAYQTLLTLRASAKLVSVVTRRASFDSYVIESIRFAEDAKSSRMLRFVAQLREIRTVESQTVQITQARAKGKTKGGKKTPGEAKDPLPKKMSFLMQAKEYAAKKWSGSP